MFFDFSRSTVQAIIFKAEMASLSINIAIMEILEKYSDELKQSKPDIAFKVKEISKQLKAGKKRWDAYKSYVDKDVLDLLKVAEEKSIPPGIIIKGYLPAKELSTSFRKNITSSLIFPVVTAVGITLMLGYAVSQFKKPIDDGMVHVSDFVMFIMQNYYLLSFSFIGIISFGLFFVPHKLPMLNAIFIKLDSMLALATIETMLGIGYSTSDILPVIRKQFNIDFDTKQRNIDGLTSLLRFAKFISPEESAEIKISTKLSTPSVPIKRIITERKEDAEQISKTIGKTVSTISLLITAGPIIMMVIVMISFLTAAGDASQSVG